MDPIQTTIVQIPVMEKRIQTTVVQVILMEDHIMVVMALEVLRQVAIRRQAVLLSDSMTCVTVQENVKHATVLALCGRATDSQEKPDALTATARAGALAATERDADSA